MMMEKQVYEAPQMEVVTMQVTQPLLDGSVGLRNANASVDGEGYYNGI